MTLLKREFDLLQLITTDYKFASKNIARSAPYMKNSEGGKAASNMKELDQDELDAMEKNM